MDPMFLDPMSPDDDLEGFRLSPQQRRAWTLLGAAPAPRASCAIRIDGRLDARRLRAALDGCARRHDLLRTRFAALPGMQEPLQVIAPVGAPMRFGVVELQECPDSARTRLLDRFCQRAERAGELPRYASPLVAALFRTGTGAAQRTQQTHETGQTLVLTLPTLCADDRTWLNLRDELATELAGSDAPGGAGADAGPPLQFVQCSEWQNEQLIDPEADAGRAFWRQPDVIGVEPTPVPLRRTRQRHPSSTLDVLPVAVGAPLAAAIDRVARQRRTTNAAVWLATLSVLAWRMTGRTPVALGVTSPGRTYEELERALGPFAKVLPTVLPLQEGDTFAEVLGRAAESLQQAEAFQDQFACDDSAIDKEEGSGPAWWPWRFEFHERADAIEAGGLRFTVTALRGLVDRADLVLRVIQIGESVHLEWIHDPWAVAPPVVALIDRYFHTLLQAAVERPAEPIEALPLLDDAARVELLETFNDDDTWTPGTAASAPPWVPEAFARAARARPDAIALRYEDETLTYGALATRVDRLARHLLRRGVGADTRVGLYLERSPHLIVAMLATLKAGGVYVPLDPHDPPDRRDVVLADAEPRMLLTTAAFRNALAASGAIPGTDPRASQRSDAREIWCLDEDLPADEGEAPVAADAVHADGAAYLLYTSGSTGTPKGVVVTHRGMANYFAWATREYALGTGPSPACSPVTFDLSLTTLLGPLLAGGQVVLFPESLGPEAILEALDRDETWAAVKMTPSHLKLIEGHGPDRVRSRIGALVIGGEALDADAGARWARRLPETRIYNEYGPTETVVGSCTHRVTADPRPWTVASVPVGRPISRTRLYVLDRHFAPVPIGVPGDLYIGGDGLARGYHRRPGVTASRFVPDPFGRPPGARLYMTGDLARYLPDGTLEFLRRADQQVKIGGMRVELEEIEAALLTHPSVRAAAVAVRDVAGATHIVAFVSVNPAHPASTLEWRRHLRTRLPGYMVPGQFVQLDTMPQTRSGKIDRRALPLETQTHGTARTSAEPPYAPPRTLIEDALAAIWTDVLGHEPIGIRDNFFARGGDSIRSIQVRARAQQRGLMLSHEQLFQHQTIAELARVVRLADGEAIPPPRTAPFALIGADDRARIPDGIVDAYPLAALQAGMIFHSELTGGSAIYHDVHSFRLQLPFDERRLRVSLGAAIARHELLRTSFDLHTFSEPLQLVHAQTPVHLTIDDLIDQDAAAQARTMARWQEDDRQVRFAWDRPPLVRFHVHRLSAETLQFTMSFHHGILDGWSAASLLTDLFNRYVRLLDDDGAPAGEPAGEPAMDEGPLAVSYRDFVALERAALASREAESFWAERLAAVSARPLPIDAHPADAPAGDAGVRVIHVPVAIEVAEGLTKVAREAAAPLKSVLLAAHLVVLGLVTLSKGVVTGVVSNGRLEEEDGDRLLGLFLNVLPMTAALRGGSWQSLIHETFELERRALPFRRYPAAALQRRNGGQPLFDVAFNYMHYHVYQGLSRATGVRVLEYDGYEETNLPLLVNVSSDVGQVRLRVSLNYRPAAIGEAQLGRIAACYSRVLSALALRSDRPYDALDLLTDDERAQVLGVSEGTAVDYGPACGLHDLVLATAARTPSAPAAIFARDTMTYGELDTRSAALAAILRTRGVGAEVRVAVCLERSLDLVVALLAVLRAGGAWVPLEPRHPPARLRHMTRDSGAHVVITTQTILQGVHASRDDDGGGAGSVGPVWPSDRLLLIDTLDLGTPSAAAASAAASSQAAAPAGRPVHPLQAAYVMYTSGSTGGPKAVVNTHAGIVNRLRWMQAAYGLTANDRVLQKTPVGFDVSVWEFFWPLITGAALVLARPGGHEDSAYLASLIAEEGITVTHWVPSMLGVWLEEPRLDTQGRTLRRIICSGEALTGAHQARVEARLPGAALANLYGPTEAAVDVSAWECVRGEAPIGGGVPLGRPIANLRWYVLGADGTPLPAGMAGELHLGGVGLARGYHDRPGLTASRFVPDPFGEAGSRLYRTGDRAQMRDDGVMEYLGRLDHQVKLRGQRIELGEIEAALAALPGVRDAAARVIDDRLIAYLVMQKGAPRLDAWRAALAAQLPPSFIPTRMMTLPALPRTPNGKLDRRLLPTPPDADGSSGEGGAPRSATERLVAEIWANVLGTDAIARDVSFFSLGGHSLNATQIVSRLRAATGKDVPLRELFDAPTVAGLAAAIDRLPESPAPSAAEGTLAAADDVDALIAGLEELSDEDLQALLRSDA